MKSIKSHKDTNLYTAVVTPFDANGNIQFSEFEALLRQQEKVGNGLVVLGSTGEGLSLTEKEKREVVDFTANLNLSVPVLVGVGGFQLPEVLDFLRFTETKNIQGYLMPVPLYAKPGLEGQTEWFQALLNAVAKPCMLYNVPSRTGVKLHPEVLRRLHQHQNLWAVKEASGSVTEFQAYRRVAPNVAFYSGDDGLMWEFSREGAVGLVSVASNVWPAETQRYVNLCLEGKAEPYLNLWKSASESLFTASNPVPAKALLQKQGMISLAKVRAPLSERDLLSVAHLDYWNLEIRDWHQKL